jgi:hypothetical protein
MLFRFLLLAMAATMATGCIVGDLVRAQAARRCRSENWTDPDARDYRTYEASCRSVCGL